MILLLLLAKKAPCSQDYDQSHAPIIQSSLSLSIKFCGVMDKYPVSFVVGSALIGIGLGIGLSFWNPENTHGKTTAILWIGLLGDLFIRALKCVVLPLVFVSIAVSVMDM